MMSPRWQKVRRDLWFNRSQTLLMILALTVSIFSVSAVGSAYSVLTQEIYTNYLGTNPASATLRTDSVDEKLLAAVRERPDIAAAEARRTVRARVQIGTNEWRPLILFVVDNFTALKVRTFSPERGAWPPSTGSLLLERSALTVLHADLGSTITLEVPGGKASRLSVSGVVHDPGQSPGWVDGFGYGYVTTSTFAALGLTPVLNELTFVVATRPDDAAHIEAVAQAMAAWLTSQGHPVGQIEIPPPQQHPHQAQMTVLLVLLGIFSLLALLLSAMLVASRSSTLIAQQVQQIGVMKAVGARTAQIVGLYLGMVLLLSLVALVIGSTTGSIAGDYGALLAAGLLNLTITSFQVPVWLYMAQISVVLLVPIAVATIPIVRSSRITVRQAISQYGTGEQVAAAGGVMALLQRFRGVSRPVMLSVRNTFRRTERLTLTIGTLVVGGGVFIAALNVAAACNQTLNAAFARQRYDVEVRLDRMQPIETLIARTRVILAIAQDEAWGYAPTSRAHPNVIDVVHTYPVGIHGGFTLYAPPQRSQLIDLPLVAGRWLPPEDTDGIVVNQAVLQNERDIGVGSAIALTLNDRVTTWRVVGIVRELGMPPAAYANYDAFA